jgi:hypothetical protein
MHCALALAALAGAARAQEAAPLASPTAPTAEEKQAAEQQAYALLEDAIGDAQSLRLPENRVRMQAAAADLLWKRDEGRARTLFASAASSLGELTRQPVSNERRGYGEVARLRQELVLAAARHDATLAYQLFQTTRPQTTDAARGRPADDEAMLEQRLLAMIAETDPAAALRRAEEMLDKGQYSAMLGGTLAQLQRTDKTAAARLTEKIISQLQPETLLANREAINLAFSLLRPGAQPAEGTPSASAAGNQLLNATAYRNLLDAVVGAALKTPAVQNVQRAPVVTGRINGQGGGPRGGGGGGRTTNTTTTTSTTAGAATGQAADAQAEQRNARALLVSAQTLLPQVEQYLPARAQALRQKLTEAGIDNNQRAVQAQQVSMAMQQGTADGLLAAAASAPPGVQPRLYQQAAFRAIAEGNPERARQIAADHLDADMRAVIADAIAEQQTLRKAKANQLEDVRQQLARLTTEEERVQLLLQLADAVRPDNPKQALQFLDDARAMVAHRAANYRQLETQLQVAHALADVEPTRGFEVLEQGINQLNELLPAAAQLSGFEINVFKDGEMTLPGNTTLSVMVARYGQELAVLAKSDFERARTTADRFQYPEARLLARLAIVQGVLGGRSTLTPNFNRPNRRAGQGPFTIIR